MRAIVTEIAILAAGMFITLACRGVIPWCAFGVWYVVLAVTGFVNTLRTLVRTATKATASP